MNIIFEPINTISQFQKQCGIGLGNFDGVHIGHAELINTLALECQARGLKSILYTFDKHPENIIRRKLITPQITTNKKKIELMNKFELDYLYFANFDEYFSRLHAEDFVKKVLVDKFGIKLAVVGHDYKFGYRGTGNADLLIKLGEKYNYQVIVIQPVYYESNIVSSTAIRKCLVHGDIPNTTNMLGRNYSIQGLVIHGRKLGTQIGFPTANLLPEKYLVLPKNGVYLTKTLLNGKLYKSITNIGKNPTFNLDKISVETHIIDFEGDLYGQMIEVFFYKWIRGERKFKGIEELKLQINKDKDFCINTNY
ncbi:MAG: bifunctional riboflavin kinase/FAD synthetase [Deltaproteobacteria bacterium]